MHASVSFTSLAEKRKLPLFDNFNPAYRLQDLLTFLHSISFSVIKNNGYIRVICILVDENFSHHNHSPTQENSVVMTYYTTL